MQKIYRTPRSFVRYRTSVRYLRHGIRIGTAVDFDVDQSHDVILLLPRTFSLIIMAILYLLWPTLFFCASVDSFAQLRLLGSIAAAPLRRKELLRLCESSSTIVESSTQSALSLGAWIPLGSASSLTGLGPTQIRVCGVDLAVWHKPLLKDAKRGAVAKEWSALVDACPHRLAPLSQGRVDPTSGCIECPYHGWSFEADGSLQKIPQLEEGRLLSAATGNSGAATSLPVHAVGDVLFVFLPTEVTGESWP
jgi:nitrite reductase/ring-hydroxylating ferredoxin subunit